MIDCCVKYCDEEATLGMVLRVLGLRIELFFCDEHYEVADKSNWEDQPNA